MIVSQILALPSLGATPTGPRGPPPEHTRDAQRREPLFFTLLLGYAQPLGG